jgi:hypothetical protein
MFPSNALITIFSLITLVSYFIRGRFEFGSTTHRALSLLSLPVSVLHEMTHITSAALTRGHFDGLVVMPWFKFTPEGRVRSPTAVYVQTKTQATAALALLAPLLLVAPALYLLATGSGATLYLGWMLLGAAALSKQDIEVALPRLPALALATVSLTSFVTAYQLLKYKPASMDAALDIAYAAVNAAQSIVVATFLRAVANIV